METSEVIELLKKADSAIHEQYKPHDTEQSIAALAIEKIQELEEKLKPDTFWNEDGDTCFDSPEEAFQYYLDESSQIGETMKLRQGISLPDAEYKMVSIDEESSSVECVLVTSK